MINSLLQMSWEQKVFCQEEEGQDLVEYSLLMAFIAMAAIAILITVGGTINNMWVGINTKLTSVAAS